MSDVLCPHCGQQHPSEVAFCPATGRSMLGAAPAGAPAPGPDPVSAAPMGAAAGPGAAGPGAPAEKGVADLLKEAYDLYRLHARALLLTCAVLFVPASIVKSCALAVILRPTVEGAAAMSESVQIDGHELEASQRALHDAYKRNADPQTIQRLQEQNVRHLQEVANRGMRAAGTAMGSFTLYVLGLLGTLVTAFFLYGIIVPLTNGALTIAVADRVLGGNAGWRQVWMLLLRRVALLLSAVIPAAILVALGFVCFVIPGLVLGLLFAFVSPVVLIEGLGGRAALRRSAELVRADWLRVAIVLVAFALVRGVAQMLAGALIPHSALFVGSLFGDLFTMVLLPVPILGAVLLYFDIRRKRDNFTQDRLRADLDALKSA